MDKLQKRLITFTRAIIEGSKNGIKAPTIINDVVVIPTVKGAVAFGDGDCFKIIIKEKMIDSDIAILISKILFTTAYCGEFGGWLMDGYRVYVDYNIEGNNCCWCVGISDKEEIMEFCKIEIEYISQNPIDYPDPFNDVEYMGGDNEYDVTVKEYGID